jgi:hypothetical protein
VQIPWEKASNPEDQDQSFHLTAIRFCSFKLHRLYWRWKAFIFFVGLLPEILILLSNGAESIQNYCRFPETASEDQDPSPFHFRAICFCSLKLRYLAF